MRTSRIFHPLSPRLSCLLGTIFTQGGAADLPIIEFLDEESAYLVRECAEALNALPQKDRLRVVVNEMRSQFQVRGLIGLDQIDPSWLLAALRGEQPTTIGIVLAQLSASARGRVMAGLPTEIRRLVPGKDDLKGVRFEMMRVVRQVFEARFATMPVPPSEPGEFYFRDIILLEGRELVQLVRALGLDELAAAFLTVGRRSLAELCQRLGRDAAEQLVAAVKQTDARDAMDLSDANTFLERMVLGLKLDEARGVGLGEVRDRFQRELFQRAGLFRLAKAARPERPLFIQQLAQRLPRSHGRLLRTYLDRIDDAAVYDEAKVQRLQDMVVHRVERLAARGKVSPKFLEFSFCYWGDDSLPEDAEQEVLADPDEDAAS